MADREKVIEGLTAMREFFGFGLPSQSHVFEAYQNILTDAIVMMKEQKAKQAIKQTYHVMMNRDYENPVEVTRYDWLCPTCKSLLCRDIDVIDDNYHFCKVCGQAVKWEWLKSSN